MQEKKNKRTCPICKKKFTPNKKRRLYCSDECHEIGTRITNTKNTMKQVNKLKEERALKRGEKVCPICNKPFMPKTANSKYCSKECSEIGRKQVKQAYNESIKDKLKEYNKEYNKKRALAKKEALKGKPSMYIKVCPHCNKEFTTTIKNVKYCPECRKLVLKEQRKAYNQTDKFKEYLKKYYSTEEYKAKRREYHQSDKFKELLRKRKEQKELEKQQTQELIVSLQNQVESLTKSLQKTKKKLEKVTLK